VSNAAAAVRRCKVRKRAGLAVLHVEVPLGPLADQLVEDRFLGAWDTESRAEITHALQRMLAVQRRVEAGPKLALRAGNIKDARWLWALITPPGERTSMFDLRRESRQPRGGIKPRNGSRALPKKHIQICTKVTCWRT
jgi:hypothetical protein